MEISNQDSNRVRLRDYFKNNIIIIVQVINLEEREINMFKNKEIDLLIGLIIGDGSIYKSNNSYTLAIGHGQSQKDYCEWKMNLINEAKIFDTEIKMHTKLIKNKYIQYRVQKTSKKLSYIYNLFTVDGKKSVKNVLKLMKSNRSVSMWFMDDGSVEPSRKKLKDGTIKYYRPNLRLCTHCFSYEENEIIKKWFFNKYKIHCNIRKEVKKNRPNKPEYFFLRFDAENTELVYRKILKEYIHICPSMEKKFKHIINFYES